MGLEGWFGFFGRLDLEIGWANILALRAALRAVSAAGAAFEPKTVLIIKLQMAVKSEAREIWWVV